MGSTDILHKVRFSFNLWFLYAIHCRVKNKIAYYTWEPNIKTLKCQLFMISEFDARYSFTLPRNIYLISLFHISRRCAEIMRRYEMIDCEGERERDDNRKPQSYVDEWNVEKEKSFLPFTRGNFRDGLCTGCIYCAVIMTECRPYLLSRPTKRCPIYLRSVQHVPPASTNVAPDRLLSVSTRAAPNDVRRVFQK